jgi:uncharacterized LabA/DUF88 family protein
MLQILVDYDNLIPLHKSRGLATIATQILGILTPSDFPQNVSNVRIRLYGGWSDQTGNSRRAQMLSAEIQASFPTVLPVSSAAGSLIVNMELAMSLLITPQELLMHTYRIRSYPSDLHCADPGDHGCGDVSCPIKHVFNFINIGRCSKPNCTMQPSNLIYRGEQKLVDTMLATDLFYLCMDGAAPLIIVSSDDDFWPTIRTVLALGSKVVHIHTKPNRRTPQHYKQYAPSDYCERGL